MSQVKRVLFDRAMEGDACDRCGLQTEVAHLTTWWDRGQFTPQGGYADTHLCADCLAECLTLVSGFRFDKTLASWRIKREEGKKLRAAGL